MPGNLPQEVKTARAEFGLKIKTTRENAKGMSLEDMRTELRSRGREITRERLRQIEDGEAAPQNETLRLVTEVLGLEIPPGMERPAPKRPASSETGTPPRILAARANLALKEGNLSPAQRAGCLLRVARVEKGLTLSGMARAVNAELPTDAHPTRSAFFSEAERGIPSLPAHALEATELVSGVSADDLGPLVRDEDPAEALRDLEGPVSILAMAAKAWIDGTAPSPAHADMVLPAVRAATTIMAGRAA